MLAFRRNVPVWTAEHLGLQPAAVLGPNADLGVENLSIPKIASRCQMVTGDNVEAKAEVLVKKLAGLHVI